MDYSKFRLRSFIIPKPYYNLRCGSNFELPVKFISFVHSDIDLLFYCYDICAIPWNRNPPKNTTCSILRIDSSETPSGYARLNIEGDRTKEKPSYYRRPPMLDNVESGGPSLQTVDQYTNTIRNQYKRVPFDVSIDSVFAIYCPYWPVEAEEWRTRKRYHGWPNEKLIARITRGGCHFVSKLRTWSSSNDTEWRFSFSKAELLLIHSWTPHQKSVYHVIRSIKRALSAQFGGDGNKGFQTYYFKTLMFWACEECSSEFWIEHDVFTCVEALFLRFHKCLNEKYCPNYFIPECNIMSHLKDEGGYQTELQALMKFVAGRELVFASITSSETEFLGTFEKECLHITQTSFPLNEHLNGRFGEYLAECEWFLPEMKDLHTAIEAHLRLMSVDNVALRKESKDCVECLGNFKSALVTNEDFYSLNYANIDLSFDEMVNAILFRKQTRNSIPIYRRSLRNCFKDALDTLVKDFEPSSLLSTVSAYRANFHFTAMQSYKESLAECDECLDIIYKVNEFAKNYTSFIPVLICNSLSQIYDEYLQVILGFATLQRNIFSSDTSKTPTAHEVCIKLDAKEFVKYLSIQCGHKLSVRPTRIDFLSYTNSDFEGPCMSQLVRNEVFSATILFAALRQSRLYTEQDPLALIPRYCCQSPNISARQFNMLLEFGKIEQEKYIRSLYFNKISVKRHQGLLSTVQQRNLRESV